MVSIVVTAYNVQDYINECIESILSQTFQDIEIIVVNDGSTDNTENRVKQIKKNNPHITYIYQSNSGVSVARNKGIEVASGDFIMFVDGDDKIHETLVSKLYSQTELFPDADIIACCCTCFGPNYNNHQHFFTDSFTCVSFDEKERLFLQLLRMEYGQPNNQDVYTAIGVPWGKLYKLSFLKNSSLSFDPSLRRMQDNVFNMYAFYKANRIVYLNECLYHYRIDHLSTYRNAYSPDIYYAVLKERRYFLEHLDQDITENLHHYFEMERLDFIFCSFRNIVKTMTKYNAVKKIRSLCDDKVYKDLFQNKNNDELSFKYKVIFFCEKMGRYDLIYYIFKIRYIR